MVTVEERRAAIERGLRLSTRFPKGQQKGEVVVREKGVVTSGVTETGQRFNIERSAEEQVRGGVPSNIKARRGFVVVRDPTRRDSFIEIRQAEFERRVSAVRREQELAKVELQQKKARITAREAEKARETIKAKEGRAKARTVGATKQETKLQSIAARYGEGSSLFKTEKRKAEQELGREVQIGITREQSLSPKARERFKITEDAGVTTFAAGGRQIATGFGGEVAGPTGFRARTEFIPGVERERVRRSKEIPKEVLSQFEKPFGMDLEVPRKVSTIPKDKPKEFGFELPGLEERIERSVKVSQATRRLEKELGFERRRKQTEEFFTEAVRAGSSFVQSPKIKKTTSFTFDPFFLEKERRKLQTKGTQQTKIINGFDKLPEGKKIFVKEEIDLFPKAPKVPKVITEPLIKTTGAGLATLSLSPVSGFEFLTKIPELSTKAFATVEATFSPRLRKIAEEEKARAGKEAGKQFLKTVTTPEGIGAVLGGALAVPLVKSPRLPKAVAKALPKPKPKEFKLETKTFKGTELIKEQVKPFGKKVLVREDGFVKVSKGRELARLETSKSLAKEVSITTGKVKQAGRTFELTQKQVGRDISGVFKDVTKSPIKRKADIFFRKVKGGELEVRRIDVSDIKQLTGKTPLTKEIRILKEKTPLLPKAPTKRVLTKTKIPFEKEAPLLTKKVPTSISKLDQRFFGIEKGKPVIGIGEKPSTVIKAVTELQKVKRIVPKGQVVKKGKIKVEKTRLTPEQEAARLVSEGKLSEFKIVPMKDIDALGQFTTFGSGKRAPRIKIAKEIKGTTEFQPTIAHELVHAKSSKAFLKFSDKLTAKFRLPYRFEPAEVLAFGLEKGLAKRGFKTGKDVTIKSPELSTVKFKGLTKETTKLEGIEIQKLVQKDVVSPTLKITKLTGRKVAKQAELRDIEFVKQPTFKDVTTKFETVELPGQGVFGVRETTIPGKLTTTREVSAATRFTRTFKREFAGKEIAGKAIGKAVSKGKEFGGRFIEEAGRAASGLARSKKAQFRFETRRVSKVKAKAPSLEGVKGVDVSGITFLKPSTIGSIISQPKIIVSVPIRTGTPSRVFTPSKSPIKTKIPSKVITPSKIRTPSKVITPTKTPIKTRTPTKTSIKTITRSLTRLRTPSKITTPPQRFIRAPPTTPPTKTPPPPIIIIKPTKLFTTPKVSKKKKKKKLKGKFQTSIIAIEENIRGGIPKRLTGLGIRPIVR